jgi:hypothetical protein
MAVQLRESWKIREDQVTKNRAPTRTLRATTTSMNSAPARVTPRRTPTPSRPLHGLSRSRVTSRRSVSSTSKIWSTSVLSRSVSTGFAASRLGRWSSPGREFRWRIS